MITLVKQLREIIAANMRFYRKDRMRLSQAELATRSGVSLMSIHRAEKGIENPRLDTLELVAKALEIPVIELFRDPSAKRAPSPQEALEALSAAFGLVVKRAKSLKKSPNVTNS